jgi:LuxR family transcriptional regulator, maltose regulon positive regulatory protein
MQQTLVLTKLHAPPPRQVVVLRPTLMAALANAKGYRLMLVSAPPGYGKTTLVSSWLAKTDLPFAWFSLDESDNDPIRFLEYTLTALHTIVPAIRLELLDLLQGQQAASFQTLMALLINEAAEAGDFFLVLDDFQVLHAPLILDMLGYLLEHLPPAMHLVLLSRTDPPLPLSRLRARGQLMEIRAEQLRFSTLEIAQFYDEVMGLKLSASDVLAIETRTEGWIAGLQLAGLAMQNPLTSPGAKDAHSFITAFTGNNAYIIDYLTEEVLRSQPEIIRSFLLQTAILDRMCGSLCEAVVTTTEPIDGQAMLETIERNHLFAIQLDSERRWYRYHHLFKEVLSRRLEALSPGKISGLHCRASAWFEQHGLIHEAIQHAMQARDSDRTARLVEQHGCDLLMGGELVTLAGWLAAIEPYTHTRPWLAMQKAWVLSLSGHPERAETAIDAGEQLLATLELTGEVRTLRGSLAAARAHWANTQGKTDLAVHAARQAIDLLGDSSDFSCSLRSVATSLLGDASWAQGKMSEARQAYADAVQIGQIAGNPHMTMMSNTSLADVYFEQGQFHQAARLYSETLQMAERIDGPDSAYAQGIHFGLGRVFYAWNRPDEAAESIEQCRRLCQQWDSVNLQAACLALNARVEHARGGMGMGQESAATAAAVTFAAAGAEQLLRQNPFSPYWSMWVRTALAHLWLDEGKIEKSFLLIRDMDFLPDDCTLDMVSLASIPLDGPISYGLEPAYLVLARLFLKLGNPDVVLTLCERMLPQARAGGRGKTETELLVLQALAFQAKKELACALTVLERAIALAWPEQFTRVFLDEGEPMMKLLYQATARGIGGEFVAEMLSVMDRPAGMGSSPMQPSQGAPVEKETQRGQQLLIEPLSAREMEVLRCIAEGCSNQEIAERFVLSPKTVKRHISNIYAKLEAKSRTQAVSLARTLKLLE